MSYLSKMHVPCLHDRKVLPMRTTESTRNATNVKREAHTWCHGKRPNKSYLYPFHILSLSLEEVLDLLGITSLMKGLWLPFWFRTGEEEHGVDGKF